MPPEECSAEDFNTSVEGTFSAEESTENVGKIDCNKSPTEIHPEMEMEEASILTSMSVYMGLGLFILFGHLRDWLRSWGWDTTMQEKAEYSNDGFVPLYNNFEAFYTRNVYQRVCHYWNHPLAGVPGAEIEIWDRKFESYNEKPQLMPTKRKYLNIGSYNYLGFAENDGSCSKQTIQEIRYGSGTTSASSRSELGTLSIHKKLETLIAEFVGKEEAIVFGMGFATNSMNLPSLVDEGCLLISDELNHASLILGARLSGAKIKVFKHNDVKDLERVLKKSVIEGQPRSRRPWKKILIVVEGVYSMEGTSCKLPELVALKNKYKAYLYLDEAHSIGAMGPTGRGVCEYYGVDPADVDILMGTFSKSFGAAGGYIAASKEVISHLRSQSHAEVYATAISPPVCRQIMAATEAIMGRDGTNEGIRRINQLAENTRYFRTELIKRGYIIYGDLGSPVVPMLLFSIAKICAFAKAALERGLAPVIVGFPATGILGSRARFCMSASHTKEHLDKVLEILEELEPSIGMKLSTKKRCIAAS